MAAFPAVLLTLGIGLSAWGSTQQGKQMAAAEAYNAQVARLEGQAAAESGKLEAEKQRKATKSLRAQQEALYAKAGVTMEGSPLQTVLDSAAEAELDAMIIEYNTKLDVMRAESAAQYSEYLGKTYRQQGLFKAGTTLLTGGALLSSM